MNKRHLIILLLTACLSLYIGQLMSQTCASFTYNTSFLTASFTNTSNCTSANRFIWYIENDTLISMDAVYIFPNCGKYNICLAAYDSLNNTIDSICDTIYLAPIGMQCHSGFKVLQARDSMNNLISGHMIVNDKSCGMNLSYLWDFGDGNSSNKKNPVSHYYGSGGPFSLCLKVDDGSCNDTYCFNIELDSNGNLKSSAKGFMLHFGEFNQELVLVQEYSMESLRVYPNPVINIVTVETTNISKEFKVELLDSQGRIVAKSGQRMSNRISMEINGPRGLYFLRIISATGVKVEKIIKQ